MRKYLVAGNWKMNGSVQQITSLLQELKPLLADIRGVDCIVCPPSIYIPLASQLINKSIIELGAQNMASQYTTAFTGEISPSMLGEFACNYVIIGHSERRVLLGESDSLVADKFAVAIDAQLTPILCVGETRAQMEEGQGFNIVQRQLQAVINKSGIKAFGSAVIAYEPVWAIGTGLNATPEQAQAMHAQIREWLASLDSTVAAIVRIIYGGSVNSSNAAALFAELDIDGGLIGGASLKAQDFSDICHAAMRIAQ